MKRCDYLLAAGLGVIPLFCMILPMFYTTFKTNPTITNFIHFLSITVIGIGTAALFRLYLIVIENRKKINEIYNSLIREKKDR